MARGALRRGHALLAGLLRCGHCGRKLHVAYGGSDGNVSRYHCKGAAINHGASGKCISFGALRIDRAVATEVLSVLRPIGVEAAIRAIEHQSDESHAKRRQVELALEQARFEAARAHRQFDAVDPGNRLVAGELERRWNERLAAVAQLQDNHDELTAERGPAMTPERRQALLDLGADLPRAWQPPNAGNESRKRILRAVLKEIVVRVGDTELQLMFHWQGGDHTELSVVKNRIGRHRWTTDAEVGQLITELARLLPDASIAALLNVLGRRTGKGHTWTEGRVRSFRSDRSIAAYRPGEREARGEVTLEQAAEVLHMSRMTVLRMIGSGTLPAQQVCKGAPWVIKHTDLVQSEGFRALQSGSSGPLPAHPDQISLEFQ